MVIDKKSTKPKRKLTLLDYNTTNPPKVIKTTINNIEKDIKDHVESELKGVKNEKVKQETKETFAKLEQEVKKNIAQIPDDILLDLKEISNKTPSENKKSLTSEQLKEVSEDYNEEDDTLSPLEAEAVKDVIKKHFDPYALKHPPRPRQEEAFKVIKNGDNVCILVPTGYGKTNVAMLACEECRKSGKIFIVLAPLKALVTEHASDAKFGEYFNIVQISGDFQGNKKKFSDPKVDGFIMTFEMFFQMLLIEKYRDLIIQRVGLVVWDEAHLVCDKSRGHRIEAIHYLLEYFHPHCKKALLSATVGNGKEFSEHFGCIPVIAEASERPVKLNKAFYPQPKVFSAKQKLQLSKYNIDMIVNMYLKNPQFPNILFFVMSREDSPKLASYINETYGSMGIHAGSHHAGMKKEARHEVEEAYRKKFGEEGKINIVVCTTTLSMGLDMPTDVCVLLGMTFYEFRKSAEKLMDNNQAIQILGRAGRGNGTLPEGFAFLFYPQEYDRTIRQMVETPLKIESQIPMHLDYILLAYLVAGIPEKDLLEIYKRTFIGEPDINLFNETLVWLRKCGFINEMGFPTDMGTKCIWFALEPKTVLHAVELKKILDNVDDIDYPTLFGLMIMNDEFCGNIAVRQNSQYDQIALENASHFLNYNRFSEICKDNEYFLDKLDTYFDQVCKAFAMTYSFHLETKFKLQKISVNNNDLYLLRSSAQRMIKGFHIIVGDAWKFGKKFRMLDRSLQSSIPVFDTEYLRLMQIKGLTSKPAYTLDSVGIHTLEKLSTLTDSEIKYASQKIKSLVESEKDLKNYEKTYVTISDMRLKDWRGEALNTLRRADKENPEIRKTEIDDVDTSIPSPIVDEPNHDPDYDAEAEIQRIEGNQP